MPFTHGRSQGQTINNYKKCGATFKVKLSHLNESHCISCGQAATLGNPATGSVGGDTWNDTTVTESEAKFSFAP